MNVATPLKSSVAKIFQFAALLFGGVAVGLLVAEFCVRFFVSVPLPAFNPPKVLVHEASQNLKLLYKPSPNTSNGSYGVLNRINSAGFRDREFAREKTPDVTRIIFLGDSVVYGYGVEQEKTIPKQLELALSNLGKNVEVLNLGVSGYDSEQGVEFFKEVGLQFNPDLVIVGYTLNDSMYASMELDFFHDRVDYQVKVPRRFVGLLYRYSHLFRFLDQKLHLQKNVKKLRAYSQKSIWHFIEDRNKALRDPIDSPYQQLKPQILKDAARLNTPPEHLKSMLGFAGFNEDGFYASHWNLSKQAFRELSQLSKKHSFKVATVIFPYMNDPAHNALRSVHRYLGNEFRQMNYEVIDLFDFGQSIHSEFGDAVKLDPIHFSAQGSSLIGDYLSRELTPIIEGSDANDLR